MIEFDGIQHYTDSRAFWGRKADSLEIVQMRDKQKNQWAKEHNIPFKAVHITTKEEAQNAQTPITTYALFKDGKYITNEQMNDTKFLKLVSN